ncbi:Membrane-bound transcription factor site-2 protease [Sesamum angolense]|uniref:Endopeptidase S2P n=1 Tax=Sesamum angolense TaxID=2727404 RepID=A0AAE1X2A3_9LAMI|nr:Membrane-bound transcription factor site-2 protease [Sesamum angolense]
MMMMEGRRRGRRGSARTLLPMRSATRPLSSTVSCWYCDFKFSALNEPLFRFGRRFSRYLRVWFSMGVGFSLAAVLGVSIIILCEFARAPLVFAGKAQPGYFLSGLSILITGLNISLPSMGYLCISSIIGVIVHELGHGLAAASEGVQVEYIAVFLAMLFPGALVAFNHTSLEVLPDMASLRIYCAGIWHNAVFCAVCTLALLLLPLILSPLYIHGESPMVLDVPSESPLYGSLSPYDVIFSLDGFRIHTAEEWKQMIAMLTEQTHLVTSGGSSGIDVEKGYCVPHSLIKQSNHVQFERNQTYCPNDLIAFASVTCLDVSKYSDGGNKNNHQNTRENIHCLDPKDVIKLKRCAHSVQIPRNGSGCLCSEVERCLKPVQLPGLGWVEITYSSLDCNNHMRSLFSDDKHSSFREKSCLQTFVFVGDLMSIAHSIRLTSYQPRWLIYSAANIPSLLEKLFTSAFHVSIVLALLNSLPGSFCSLSFVLFFASEMQIFFPLPVS